MVLGILPFLPAVWAAIAEVKDVPLEKQLLASLLGAGLLACIYMPLSFLALAEVLKITLFGIEIPTAFAIFIPLIAFVWGMFAYWAVIFPTRVFERIVGI